MSNGEQVLWEGEKKSLTNAATAGKIARARYRMTSEMLYFDAGLVSTSSEQIPLWAVRDVDVKQTMTQKARKVGDVIVHVQHSDYTGRDEITLESVEDPKRVRDLLNGHAQRARHEYQARDQTVHYQGAPPMAGAPGSPPAVPSASVDVADQLQKLAGLRDAGVLTDDEFAAQKAKLLS